MDNSDYRMAQPSQSVIEFFAMFSRFEFALLAAEYVGGDVGDNAWADWDRFSTELHKSFFDNVRKDPEVEVIFREPPRKLVKQDEKICIFVDVAPPSDSVNLLLAVRRVRNNLFHGSKVFFRPRDKELVMAGTIVLRHALEASILSAETNCVSSAFAYADDLGDP